MRWNAGIFFLMGAALTIAVSPGCKKHEEPALEVVEEEAAVVEDSAPAPALETYKGGALFSVTGPASSLGDPEKKTAERVVNEINKEGGINGHPVELIVYDTGGEKTTAVMHMRKLVDKDQALAVAGPSDSGPTMAIVNIAEESQIPPVSCAASVLISQPVRKWVFQTPRGAAPSNLPRAAAQSISRSASQRRAISTRATVVAIT
jgi:ABC-type branched-subunit amino acid transport system substrate-binding protein